MTDVVIELRKYALTRSGRVILIILAGLLLVLAASGAALSQPVTATAAFGYPSALLEVSIPLVIVMMFTAEWSSRDAVQTFLLRPRRVGVLAAKAAAAAVICVAGMVWVVALTVLATAVRGSVSGARVGFGPASGFPARILESAGTLACYAVFAVGVGLLVARTAAALVVYLGVVAVVDTLLALVLGTASAWVSLGSAVGRIVHPGLVRGADLPPIGTAVALWIVLPLSLGVLLFQRREAK